MTESPFSRTEMLLGAAALKTLSQARVAVFGVGGVGGYAVEVLARSGVGAIDLYDNDIVNMSNINRQIIATMSTVGMPKVDVAKQRVLDINPQCKVVTHKMFYVVANADEVDLSVYDYVLDCIDTVSAKMELVRRCTRMGVPLICSMGAANKLDPTAFRVADISKTNIDPLARIMRKRLRREGIRHFKCVFSEEQPLRPLTGCEESGDGEDRQACQCADASESADNEPVKAARPIPASNAFVPAAAGLVVGGEVVKDLLRKAGTLRTDAEPTP